MLSPLYGNLGPLGSATRRSYIQRVLNTRSASLIAYWPLYEPSGTTMTNLSAAGSARDGTYTNITLAQAGIGDGQTSASFNGTSSVANAHTTSFSNAFNGDLGTIFGWFKVSGSGVWTDGTIRRPLRFSVDGNNGVFVTRAVVNNRITVAYVAGGTTKTVNIDSLTTTAFFPVAMTWNKAGDAMKAYSNGAQSGATQTGLGTWAGTLSSTLTILGALTSAGAANVWSGYSAHVAVWTAELSAGEIASLSLV